MTSRKWSLATAPITIAVILLLSVAPVQWANAQPATAITATPAQIPVNLSAPFSASEWSDTQMLTISAAGMTVAFKYNATGLLFLLQWSNGTPDCNDQYCFGGIELGFLNNTGVMGTQLTPSTMVLLSPSFNRTVDEFISEGATTPSTVESQNYKTQSTCSLTLSGTTYNGECYRPFKLVDASPHDPFLSLVGGSPIEIAFAVGTFNKPGQHTATNMLSYTLSLQPSSILSSTSSATSTSSRTSPSVAPATFYAEELLVIVVGFTALVFVVLRRYQ